MGRMLNNAWVVCGPESSGSVFLAKTLSFALKKCNFFGEYSGYGYNSNTSCENPVLHRSIPYMRPRKWDTDLMQEVSRFSPQFRRVKNYVLTTRCKQITILSKCRRFGDTMHTAMMTIRSRFLSFNHWSKIRAHIYGITRRWYY